MRKSYEIDMCNGPLTSGILLFALPLMMSGILQLLFNAADIVVVGRFAGSHAMAAVGSTSSLINLLVNFFIGISTGVNVLVARYCGAQSYQDTQETVQTSLLVAIGGGFILLFLGIGTARPMLELMGTPADVLDQAVLYMKLYFIGMPATMLYNFGAAILRAVGDTRRPLYFLLISGIINVVCNLVFVIGFHMGVSGVAIATVISQYISALLILWCLAGMDGPCHASFRNLSFHREKLAQIMQVGLPAGLQSVMFNISNVLIQSSVNSFGAVVVAGNTAASNIEGFIYTAANAIYQTNLSFTSQNMGAKNYHRIDKIALCCLAMVAICDSLLCGGAYLFGNQLLSIYSADPEVIAYGMVRMGTVGLFCVLSGIMDVIAGSVRGMGYSMLPMLVTMTGACLFRIVWIFMVFQWNSTLVTLYISYPISWVLTSLAHGICYLILRRKVLRNTEETPVQTA